MGNCFLCNSKLKRKSHYLCKDWYNMVNEAYYDFCDNCPDCEAFVINVLNGKIYHSDGKLDYLVALKYLFEMSIDEMLSLLVGNDIVLKNANTMNDIILENEKLVKKLNELTNSNYAPEQTGTRYKNKSHLCDDGHIVKSNAEFRIDQFLYKNNIAHAYEKTITLKDGSQIHPDFYIPEIDVYIEYHGVKGSSWYNKMNKYKDNIFKIEQMIVIVINYKDEERIEQILPKLLNLNGLNKTFK